MANGLYDITRRRMLSNQFNWVTMPVRMLAFTAEYEFDPTDENVNDLGVAISAESEVFTGQAVSSRGYAQSDQAWFQNLVLSPPWVFLVLVDETQGGLSRELLAYYDTGYNLPRTINGQDQIVIPDWFNQQGWFAP
jgi:hypothetical protein